MHAAWPHEPPGVLTTLGGDACGSLTRGYQARVVGSTEEKSFLGWVVLLVAFGVFGVFIGVLLVVFYWCFLGFIGDFFCGF